LKRVGDGEQSLAVVGRGGIAFLLGQVIHLGHQLLVRDQLITFAQTEQAVGELDTVGQAAGQLVDDLHAVDVFPDELGQRMGHCTGRTLCAHDGLACL
jgi:hypothetical protein